MLKPLKDNILVTKMTKKEEKSASGLILPSDDSFASGGKVIAIGEGRTALNSKLIPLDVKVGDTILFPSRAGRELEDGILMNINEVMAILED